MSADLSAGRCCNSKMDAYTPPTTTTIKEYTSVIVCNEKDEQV